MAAKFYQVTKEINGVTYTAQFSGLSAWLRCVDMSHIDGSEAISAEKIAKNALEMGIIDPKVGIDDFDDVDEMQEVAVFAQQVLKGKFRGSAKEKAAKAKGEG